MIPLTVVGKEFRCQCWSDLAAVYRVTDDNGQLYAISLAASSQEIQAIAAGLADGSMSFGWAWDDPENWKAINRWKKFVSPAGGGFDCRKAKLEFDTWHLVAVNKSRNFMLHASDEALWQILRSDQFTTPILRPWAPEIRRELTQRNHLRKCDSFGPCDPQVLFANDKVLDTIVSEGVGSGRLRMEAQAA